MTDQDESHDARAGVAFTDIYVDDDIVDRVSDTLRSTRYVKGERVERFEAAFADRCGTDHAVGVNSGTAALLLSMQSAGIGPGDEVFVPGHTFFASVSPVLHLGATPVFVDVDPRTCTMDPDDLAAKAERAENPTAVVPVHLYGQLADLDAILDVADDHDLTVVEDACQAHFATRDGHTAGASGDAGAFSFYPSKNMTVGGDGGMLVTDDADLATRARRLRDHGRDEEGVHREVGLNYRMSEVSAAVGREQLDRVQEWNDARAAAAARYDGLLAAVDGVETPTVADGAQHVYHLYVVQVPAADRDPLRDYLAARDIETGVHYETPAHQHPAVAERVGDVSLPRTEALCDRIVSLPMHPRIAPEDVETVCAAVASYFEGKQGGVAESEPDDPADSGTTESDPEEPTDTSPARTDGGREESQ
ncbi:DegT/DnrJ/EryC1/StrS family aminotransferase [Halomarina salina]|uniref:DegT/DnrJ/EryC1/StrS family aminotransferase n=1 Tax=Halomarina salina TaxID=1872699 RepID=A0ABD5RTX8_9EURY|nr:DegT/DnrJ/EryC1/StrS family aminotransferase [Halomarina salina]